MTRQVDKLRERDVGRKKNCASINWKISSHVAGKKLGTLVADIFFFLTENIIKGKQF